jgi:ribosomal protein L32
MAVPKNAHLNQKTNKRKTVWKRMKQSVKAYSLYSIVKKKLQMLMYL